MIKIGTILQTNWDWRAACNFILGGTGSALLLMTVLATFPQAAPLPLGLVALAFVGAGLGFVWLELGRPWRAFNVFFHPQTSWMTREAFVAVVTFALALVGVAFKLPVVVAAAGLAGLAFLYCQARILKASKGIPAWREPVIVPLILATGFAEGTALLLILMTALGSAPVWLSYALLGFLILRVVVWSNYRSKLAASGVPETTLAQLARISGMFIVFGNVVPAILSIIGLALPDAAVVLGVATGVLAIWGGWQMKFTIVTRAAQVQGYAFGRLRRGHPLAKGRS